MPEILKGARSIVIRRLDETSPSDYLEIGLRSGLEIHQQLDTEKKLFCRCPVLPYRDDYDAQVLRHMRPTLSELGEYDGTALMEFKTRKNIIYQINKNTICTYEIDDTPPFELNRQALEFGLEITMLLNCKLVSEIHVQRKQYLDGSIPAGFQRTTILGVDGWIPFGDRRINIIQLGLEEDACREVSDRGHLRVYLTDRLGIPLIETVTAPEMRTPHEVAQVARILSNLARASGKVRRGIGAARQDVNVSVEGGRRVEIKGVSRIPEIPLLVHNEAFRQVSLLEIKAELGRRGIGDTDFSHRVLDQTGELAGTSSPPAASALKQGHRLRSVLLRGYSGLLSVPTQPGKTFADEISDRVRVIACLDTLPNIVHDGGGGESFSGAEWEILKRNASFRPEDALVVVWGSPEDLETAVGEIAIRAREAIDGVINETRQSLPDGTNGFERILPGPNRMYPDTDLPPIAIGNELIGRITSGLPERPWEREERYVTAGAAPESARQMSISPLRDLYDEALKVSDYSPGELMHFFLSTLSHLKKRIDVREVPGDVLLHVLSATGDSGLPLEAAAAVLRSVCIPGGINISDALKALEIPGDDEIRKMAGDLVREMDTETMGEGALARRLTGMIVEKSGFLAKGARVTEIVREFIPAGSEFAASSRNSRR
ncbi:MAG: Glu-tRNA(Gln) amidotransferase subunit GatE [Candidatus Fermentibacteraceae bacterium]|nr:Glu-tRNA(Gln) amidotransferase subunit GatE [Candidatus Fermentibacteraceae bacterium]